MSEQRRRGPMGGHGRMMSGEKAKDFKGSMAKLFRYMGRYKFRLNKIAARWPAKAVAQFYFY